MNKFVLDASAVLAVANSEPGQEKVRPFLQRSVIGAVNLSEVLGKLVEKGMTLAQAEDDVRQFVGEVVPLDFSLASLTAELFPLAKPFGLSLGDRACLALGKQLNLTVLTAEQNWAKLNIGVQIELIRQYPS